MRPPRRYAYSSELVNGTSFGKMISHIVIIKELEVILDDQAGHTEETYTHRGDGQEKRKAEVGVLQSRKKENQQSYKQQGRVLPVPHGCQRDPGPVNTLSGLLALCCRKWISVKGVNLLRHP